MAHSPGSPPPGGGLSGGKKRPPGGRTAIDTSRLARMTADTGRAAGRATGSAAGPAGGRSRPTLRRRAARAARAAGAAAWRKGSAYLGDSVGAGWAVRAANTLVARVGGKRLALAAAAAVVVLCCVPAGGVVAVFGVFGVAPQPALPGLAGCVTNATESDRQAVAELDRQQRDHAALIVEVGRDLGAPPRAWVIAVATALQESSLRNLPHLGPRNDHDSLGLFQQRPSAGWGTPDQLRDPAYAATAFYQALLAVDGWERMALAEAAQAVQRSAYPDAYARHEPLAVALVNDATGGVAGAAATDAQLRCADWHEVTAAGWTAPAPGPVWSGFRPANRPDHHGIDIGAARGTPVRAASDGQVILVACNATLGGEPYSCDVDGSPAVTGCGWYVNIRHAGGVVTRYCHLAQLPDVQVGEWVAAGQQIGLLGSSGRSSGPHLHFEVELRSRDGERRQIDPLPFLAARGVVLECTGAPVDCTPAR